MSSFRSSMHRTPQAPVALHRPLCSFARSSHGGAWPTARASRHTQPRRLLTLEIGCFAVQHGLLLPRGAARRAALQLCGSARCPTGAAKRRFYQAGRWLHGSRYGMLQAHVALGSPLPRLQLDSLSPPIPAVHAQRLCDARIRLVLPTFAVSRFHSTTRKVMYT